MARTMQTNPKYARHKSARKELPTVPAGKTAPTTGGVRKPRYRVLDEGRIMTSFSIQLHANRGQQRVKFNMHPDHLSEVLGVADSGMSCIKEIKITKVDHSHPGVVSGLSLYDGKTGPPIESQSAGFTVSNRDGALHMHHVALNAVTPEHPGVVQFSNVDSEEGHRRYKFVAERAKYNLHHSADDGVHIVEPENGLDPVFLTEVGKKYPLGVLCASNLSLNKKDASGNDVFHVANGKTYHVLKKEDFEAAQKSLKGYLKPDKLHAPLRWEVNTQEPPSHPYSLTLHGEIVRHNFIEENGRPMDEDAPVQPRVDNNFKNSPTGQVPGYPDVCGTWTMKPWKQDDTN